MQISGRSKQSPLSLKTISLHSSTPQPLTMSQLDMPTHMLWMYGYCSVVCVEYFHSDFGQPNRIVKQT